MNTIFILSLFILGIIGIYINKYWEAQLTMIIQKQIKINVSSNATDVLISLFGNSVKINKIDKIEGIGADYYSQINDEFFLTEETDKYNTASVTIGYFLGLLKIAFEKVGSISTFAKILRLILNPLLIIFAIFAILSINIIYIYIFVGIYIILIFLDIILNKIYFLVTKPFVIKSFKNKISISQDVFIFLNKYVSTRWLHLVTTLIFRPLLVSYYYIYFFIKK